MSFRIKVFLSITVTVLIAVWVVAAVVSALVTNSFERREAQRTAALVAEFQREFDRRGQEVARRIDAIANSDTVQRMAVNLAGPQPDASRYVDEAPALAREQSLNFLELVGPDGRIISSAEWPARFGYQESWLLEPVDWKAQGVFLKREDLADGATLGLVTVRGVKTGERTLYVAGGSQLDKEFFDSLPVAEGMRVQLYRNFEPRPAPDTLGSALAATLIQQVQQQPRELTRTSPAASISAIPLIGRDKQLLAILLVESSRAELATLKRTIQATAWGVGAVGVLLGLILSFWTASRITRPLRALAGSVRQVAAGDWNTRAVVDSRDEIGQLARDFNHMTEQLSEQRDRMIQAERVAAWRELARRLAHELKNPLFPLQITVENLQRSRQASPEQFDEVFRESTTTLLAELDNLKTIIGRFSDFAKMPAPHLESVNLNDTVREVLKLFEAQIRAPGHAPIDVRLETEQNLASIAADSDQIRRALRNLVLNALDAMPKGGTLTIRTQNVNGTAGTRVAVEVSDTGEGLTPEECERLFTPYYTTKQHGTGLGLAIVQSVVSDHKGTISVHSQPGHGTTFRIELNR
ncbi:MAG TPA: ATP-binding protein [Bryobacteraceae bacterium]|nr:ATP-binding protein [Bryobacteraceae bacterium]